MKSISDGSTEKKCNIHKVTLARFACNFYEYLIYKRTYKLYFTDIYNEKDRGGFIRP